MAFVVTNNPNLATITITLRYIEPPSGSEYFNIQYKEVNKNDWLTLISSTDVSRLSLAILEIPFLYGGNNKVYDFRIIFYNSSGVEISHISARTVSCFNGSFILDASNSYNIKPEWEINSYSTSNPMAVYSPFNSTYPTAAKNSIQEHKTSQYTAILLNNNETDFDRNAQVALKKNFENWMSNGQVKLIKTTNGDVLVVYVDQAISSSYFKELANGIASSSFNWVECGDISMAEGLGLENTLITTAVATTHTINIYTFYQNTDGTFSAGNSGATVTSSTTGTLSAYDSTNKKYVISGVVDSEVNPSSTTITLTQGASPFNNGTITWYRGTSNAGVSLGDGLSKKLEVTGDINLAIYVTRNTYSLQINTSTGISSADGSGTYRHGQTVSIIATASTGYTFNNWAVVSGDSPASTSSASTTITLTQNTTLTATATANTYSLTLIVNPNIESISYKIGDAAWATTTATTSVNVLYGTTYSVYATPATDCATQFDSATNAMTSTLSGNESFNPVATITVRFVVDNVTHGVVTESAVSNLSYASRLIINNNKITVTNKYQQEITITANNNSGYSFSNWTIDGNVISGSYTILEPKTVTANFTQNSYVVSF